MSILEIRQQVLSESSELGFRSKDRSLRVIVMGLVGFHSAHERRLDFKQMAKMSVACAFKTPTNRSTPVEITVEMVNGKVGTKFDKTKPTSLRPKQSLRRKSVRAW